MSFDPTAVFRQGANPLDLVTASLERAREREPFPIDPMSLATVDAHGRPSVRIVLLKAVDARGLCFFTNRGSRKGRELENGSAAVCMHFPKGEEQIRVEGWVEQLSGDDSDAYFASRPRQSQLGAWASKQSEPLANRTELEARFRKFEKQFEGRAVERPAHWGGYRLVPDRIEFWFGRENRLHERYVYARELGGVDQVPGSWILSLLYP